MKLQIADRTTQNLQPVKNVIGMEEGDGECGVTRHADALHH